MLSKLLFILLIFIVLFLYTYFKGKSHRNSLTRFLFFILLILLALSFAFREFIFVDNIGTDYETYREWFNFRNFSNSFNGYQNIGFNILISLTKLIYNNYYFFLFICGLIINYFILKFIDENINDTFFAVILYLCLFYFLTFNVMRQWMSCALFLYSFKYIKRNDFFKYCLIIIIASTFHDTAITLLILYPLINLKIQKVYKVEIILFAISTILFFKIDSVIYFLNKICILIGSDYFSKYSMEYMTTQAGNSTIAIISIFLLILLNFNIYKKRENLNNNSIYIYYFLILIPISLLSTRNGIFARYLIYFDCSLLPIFPISLELFENKSKLTLKFLIIIILICKFILI